MTPQPDQTSAVPLIRTRITGRIYDTGRYMLIVSDYNNEMHPGATFRLNDATDSERSFEFNGNDPDLELILEMLNRAMGDLRTTRSGS